MFKDSFNDCVIKVFKKNSILVQMKEKKEFENRQEFLRRLKYGKPRGRTRPPVRLAPRVPRQLDGGGLDD